MGNAIGQAARQPFPPSADVLPTSAGAGPSSSQEEDPVLFVSNFFDEFLGYLRNKFQERARGLNRGLPSPFCPFVDSPEPAPGTGHDEPIYDPVFLALLQYLIETTLEEGLKYPLSRDVVDLFLRAFRGRAYFPMRKDDDPVIDTDILAVGKKLTSLGNQFRAAGIRWKGALGAGGRSSLGLTIGIDLGTSYTRAAAETNGSLEIIRNDKGYEMTPSWVACSTMGPVIGEGAKKRATVNPEGSAFNFKRLIGRRFVDKDVREDMKLVPYQMLGMEGKPVICLKMERFKFWSNFFSPEDCTEIVLAKIKKDAEQTFSKTIMNAIVTVPAYFDTAQRQATEYACDKASLNLVTTINEPTAVAIAYGRHKQVVQNNILVCHLGGGTFDVSILVIDHGAFVVLATNGGKLGGEDFDKNVMRYFIKGINEKHGKEIRWDKLALAKLRRACERAKRALSSIQEVQIEIRSLCEGLDFSELLTRDLFEELNDDLFMNIVWHVNKTMKDAGLDKDQIDDVVLAGGSSEIPKIRQLLKDYFNGKEPEMELNPDEAARDGAAIIGGTLSGTGSVDTKDILILDVVPAIDGTGAMNSLIHRNLMIPTRQFEEGNQGCLLAMLGLVARWRWCWTF